MSRSTLNFRIASEKAPGCNAKSSAGGAPAAGGTIGAGTTAAGTICAAPAPTAGGMTGAGAAMLFNAAIRAWFLVCATMVSFFCRICLTVLVSLQRWLLCLFLFLSFALILDQSLLPAQRKRVIISRRLVLGIGQCAIIKYSLAFNVLRYFILLAFIMSK